MLQYIKREKNTLLGIGLLLLLEGFFFRNVLFTDRLIGSLWDGKLTNFMTEHWYKVFQGKERFDTLLMFYPHANTIAYSDMLLGYGLIYSIFRLLGADLFISYKATMFLVHFLGTVCCFRFLTKYCKTDVFWGLLGTSLYAYSSAFSLAFEHTQLAAIGFVPLCLCLFGAAWERRESRKTSVTYLTLAGSMLALLMYTSWYIGYFFFLAAGIGLVTWLLHGVICRRSVRGKISRFWRFFSWRILIPCLTFLILMIPFVLIYLPSLKEHGTRKWSETVCHMPQWVDLINVSGANLLSGWLPEILQLDQRDYVSQEIRMGQPVLVWILLLMLLFMVIRKKSGAGEKRLLLFGWGALLLGYALILRTKGGLSLWYLVYKILPGAASLRAVGRWWFFLTLPAGILAGVTGNYLTREMSRTKTVKELGALLLILCIAANVLADGVYSEWDRKTDLMVLSTVAAPPADCEVFFLDFPDSTAIFASFQMLAFEIATVYEVPTINGYSGQYPEHFRYMKDFGTEHYLDDVLAYAALNGIREIYRYDISVNEWKKFTVTP